MIRYCEHCNGPIPTHTPKGQRKQNYARARFCSHACRNEGQRGNNHARKATPDPAVHGRITMPDRPFDLTTGRVLALRRAHGIKV